MYHITADKPNSLTESFKSTVILCRPAGIYYCLQQPPQNNDIQ